MHRTELGMWRERDKRSMATMERILFPVFLFVTVVDRIVPGGRSQGGPAGKSIFSEAMDRTHSVVPWFYLFR